MSALVMHDCRALGCRKRLRYPQFFCYDEWALVPIPRRRAIFNAWYSMRKDQTSVKGINKLAREIRKASEEIEDKKNRKAQREQRKKIKGDRS